MKINFRTYFFIVTEAQTSKDNLEARLGSLNIIATNQRDIFNRWNSSLVDKIQNLKEKVEQARRLASEVSKTESIGIDSDPIRRIGLLNY